MDLSLEQFRDARITSAVTHKGVAFPRVVRWARETFADTPWASRIRAVQAFQLDRQSQSAGGIRRALREGLNMDEFKDILSWVKEKSQRWGLQPLQIANMLDLADLAAPSLIPLVRQRTQSREEVLTRPMLRTITEEIPDHQQQEAIARKSIVERLNESEVRKLVSRLQGAQSPEEKQILLSTSWLDLQEEEKRERESKSRSLSEEEITRERERMIISMGIDLIYNAALAIERLREEPMDTYPDLKQAYSRAIDLLELNLECLTEEKRGVIEELKTQINSLTQENKDYSAEVARLNRIIRSYQKTIGIAQRIDEENRFRD